MAFDGDNAPGCAHHLPMYTHESLGPRPARIARAIEIRLPDFRRKPASLLSDRSKAATHFRRQPALRSHGNGDCGVFDTQFGSAYYRPRTYLLHKSCSTAVGVTAVVVQKVRRRSYTEILLAIYTVVITYEYIA